MIAGDSVEIIRQIRFFGLVYHSQAADIAARRLELGVNGVDGG